MVIAAADFSSTSRSSTPSSRETSLTRKLAAVAGAAGAASAAAIGASEAHAVVYTPTAGVVAAQGIPGFSFDTSTNTATLGNLRSPGRLGVGLRGGATPIQWDIDGGGTNDFTLSATVNNAGADARFKPLVGAGLLQGATSQVFGTRTFFFPYFRNASTGALVSANLPNPAGNVQAWANQVRQMTVAQATVGYGTLFNLNNFNADFPSGVSGQFGFRFTEASDTYYGWGSLSINPNTDLTGWAITEAYYNSTPNGSINVGAVPAVPVPEPTSMALLGLGAAGVAAWRARRKAKAEAATRGPTKVEA